MVGTVAEAMCWVGWVGGIENKAQTKCLDLGCGKKKLCQLRPSYPSEIGE